jgi:superfamily II DNA/RNA helicase
MYGRPYESPTQAAKVPLLVATDVASRGLHVPSLPYVVNYDFPSNLETYIHRVGRTGREGNRVEGYAYSFFTHHVRVLAPGLVALLKECTQKVDPNLATLATDVELEGSGRSDTHEGSTSRGREDDDEGDERDSTTIVKVPPKKVIAIDEGAIKDPSFGRLKSSKRVKIGGGGGKKAKLS